MKYNTKMWQASVNHKSQGKAWKLSFG